MEQNEATRSTEVRQAEVRFRRNKAGSSRYRSFRQPPESRTIENSAEKNTLE